MGNETIDQDKNAIYQKRYREEHKEKRAAYNKRWETGHKKERAAQRKRYRLKHKEEGIAYRKRWYAEHKEEKALRDKPYNLANKEKRNATSKRWAQENPEKISAAKKRYYTANPEARRLREQQRRALKKQALGVFKLQDWKEIKKKYKNACPACGRKEPEVKLTVDHIIPLSKGGKHDKSNIQPLCLNCNSRKHTYTCKWNQKGQLEFILETQSE